MELGEDQGSSAASRSGPLMGADYLYTKFSFDIDAVYNPGKATSYEFGDGGMPCAARGSLPVATDAAIRHQLMQPRQQLIYAVNDTILLESPYPGFSTDAFIGPMPISCHIPRSSAPRLFCDPSYKIESWVNECQDPDEASDDPILSFLATRSTTRSTARG